MEDLRQKKKEKKRSEEHMCGGRKEKHCRGKRATISSKKVGEKRVTKKRKIKVVRK